MISKLDYCKRQLLQGLTAYPLRARRWKTAAWLAAALAILTAVALLSR